MSVAIAVSNDSLQITDVRRRLKAIFIGSIGNLVEWYDFYAYAAFSLYKNRTAVECRCAVCNWFHRKADRRLVVRASCRSSRPAQRAHAVGVIDELRFVDDRGLTDIR